MEVISVLPNPLVDLSVVGKLLVTKMSVVLACSTINCDILSPHFIDWGSLPKLKRTTPMSR